MNFKPVLILAIFSLLGACASPEDAPPDPNPTKAEVQAREQFAQELPKPSER
jgi:hypothetical protein